MTDTKPLEVGAPTDLPKKDIFSIGVMSCHASGCCFGHYNLERGGLVISVLGMIFRTASLIYWCVAVEWIQIITCAFFATSSGILFYGVM